MVLRIIHYLVNSMLARFGKRVVCFSLAIVKNKIVVSGDVNERIFQRLNFIGNFIEPERGFFNIILKIPRLLRLINNIGARIQFFAFYQRFQ